MKRKSKEYEMPNWLKRLFYSIYSRISGRSDRPGERFSTRRTGNRAEDAAYHFLRKQGYRIVARNYRRRYGEIDLIGWDGEFLAFIEVKYRSGPSRGLPLEAVHRRKQRQICRMAREYRIRHKLHDVNFRFDVVSIQKGLETPNIELIKGAFREVGR